MSSPKIFTGLMIVLIVKSIVDCGIPVSTVNNSIKAKFRFLFNNEEIVKTFIVDMPNSDTIRSDILPDIKANQDRRLQESLIMQTDRLQQMQDINSKLVQSMNIMNQQKEELYNNITSIVDLKLEKKFDKLLKETKQFFENQQCEKRKSCAEIFTCLGNASNGIYQLYLPDFSLNPFEAYCLQDPDNGTAWTVIQRRKNNSTNFDRNWEDYERGFGGLNGDFFIGLENLHSMTQAQPHELWIQMEHLETGKLSGKFDLFAIGNESDKYVWSTWGNSSGNLQGLLSDYKGYKFSTKDNGNDGSSERNCAKRGKGGWWYPKNDCGGWHPNGRMDDRLQYFHLAIRPTNSP